MRVEKKKPGSDKAYSSLEQEIKKEVSKETVETKETETVAKKDFHKEKEIEGRSPKKDRDRGSRNKTQQSRQT